MTKRLTKLTDALLRQHGAILLAFHISVIFWSLILAWLLRYDFAVKNQNLILSAAPVLILLRITALSRFKLLHGYWRYTGLEDAIEIAKAVLLGSVAFFLVLRIILKVTAFPLSLYIIEGLITGCVLVGVRVAFRVLAEAGARVYPENGRKQVLIIGAGFAAQMIIRELRSTTLGYWVVGCLDDDPTKIGLRILGKPVLGRIDELRDIAQAEGIHEVLIAIPSATGAEMRRIVHCCEDAGVKFSTVPSLHDLISGKASINELRSVKLEDLLGRQPVLLDLDLVRDVISGKTIMVTGAAGSIGSELCRQILAYNPSKLICLDQSETGLFYLQMELGAERAVYCVADYTSPDRMRRLFTLHAIQIVFHAGAYKHVPLMEENPREALENNVFGLSRLLDVAQEKECEKFILISSDKAVNPTSVMGCTKRMGELVLASRPNASMQCVSVRFGNVLGSQGSVVPVFQKQLAERSSITVTHPEMTRFFMTIREAVSLVLQASAIGKHQDVLVLDMGDPVRILDLARTLIRLSGKAENAVKIIFTGLRPGEKLHEALFGDEDVVLNTPCPKIKRTLVPRTNQKRLLALLTRLRGEMFDISDTEVRMRMREIVPEYKFEGLPLNEPFMATGWPVSAATTEAVAASGDD